MPGATGAVEALALYAGQSAGLINDLLPATAIVDELVSGAARALERAARPVGLGGRAKVA